MGQNAGRENKVKMIGYVFWFVIVFASAGFGARYMPGAWYAALNKPVWNPPNWIFGPVWTLLYVMMAAAAGIVFNSASSSAMRTTALSLFLIQLVLNSLWSWIFFGLHRPGAAFAEICFMWTAIAATAVTFFRCDITAGWLMLPYLGWVSFASVLNFAVWRLNR